MVDVIDFILGKKQLSIKNCSRDAEDPRVTRCEITIQESGGVVRKGQIETIGDNKRVYPIAKSGGLTDDDFNDTIKFLNNGGWKNVVPNIKSSLDAEKD